MTHFFLFFFLPQQLTFNSIRYLGGNETILAVEKGGATPSKIISVLYPCLSNIHPIFMKIDILWGLKNLN